MRKLKHYDAYLSRLLAFSEALHIKVVFDEEPSEGVWMPTKQLIRIDDTLSNSDTIAVFLHELGHALEDLTQDKFADVDKAYFSIYGSRFTQRQKKIVIGVEKKAWVVGRQIASRLKIRLGNWYTQSAQDGLKDYKNL